MSEFESGRDRRLSPRFNASLECRVTLPDEGQSSRLLFPGAEIAGQTRDVSATGLGLVVPTIYIGYDCIVDQGRTLIVSLELTTGAVEMRATSVHYVRQDASDGESIYLVGLHITDMADDDRARYSEFLAGLSE
jgi:PilZ domain